MPVIGIQLRIPHNILYWGTTIIYIPMVKANVCRYYALYSLFPSPHLAFCYLVSTCGESMRMRLTVRGECGQVVDLSSTETFLMVNLTLVLKLSLGDIIAYTA